MKAEKHWDHYSELVETVADLRALYEHAEEQHEEAIRDEKADQGTVFKLRARTAILKAMLDRSLVPGNQWPPPKWEELTPVRRKGLSDQFDELHRAPRAQALLEGIEDYLDGRPEQLIPDTMIDFFRKVIAYADTPYQEEDAANAVENLRDFFRRRNEDFPSSPSDFVKKLGPK